MPIHEYLCRGCAKRFEALVLGARKAVCPACSGTDLEKQFSVFAAGGNSAGTASRERASAPGPCGSCGDPRGPGACTNKF